MDEEWSYAVRRIGRACVCGAAKMKEEGEGEWKTRRREEGMGKTCCFGLVTLISFHRAKPLPPLALTGATTPIGTWECIGRCHLVAIGKMLLSRRCRRSPCARSTPSEVGADIDERKRRTDRSLRAMASSPVRSKRAASSLDNLSILSL